VLTALAADDRTTALRRAVARDAREAHREPSTHDLLDALAELTLSAQAAAGRRWWRAA
jgi:hypothetical protein